MARLLLLFALCSVMSPRAEAQDRPAILVNSGATIPTADYGDFHGSGPSLGVAVEFELSPPLMLQGTAGYYSLPVLSQRGRESGLYAMGNLKVLVPTRASPIGAYLLGGIGVWRTGFSDLWVSTDGVSPRPGREGQERSRFAGNVGAGVTVSLTEAVVLFGQVRYVMVSSDGPRIRMIPLELGFAYRRR